MPPVNTDKYNKGVLHLISMAFSFAARRTRQPIGGKEAAPQSRVLRGLLRLILVALLLQASAIAAPIILGPEDVKYMEQVEKLRPNILLCAHLCRYGEILVVRRLDDSFQELLIVKGENETAQMFIQDLPRLIHFATIDGTGGIRYLDSSFSKWDATTMIARPDRWPTDEKGVPNFKQLLSTPDNPPCLIIGKSVLAISNSAECAGVLYQLHDGRLFYPVQPKKIVYTPSLCFANRESPAEIAVRDLRFPDRPLCRISRRNIGEPSVIVWPNNNQTIWPYMTDDDCPVLPTTTKFLSATSDPIEPSYTFTDKQGVIQKRLVPVMR